MKRGSPTVPSINRKHNTKENLSLFDQLEAFFNESSDSFAEKLIAFPKYIPRQRLTDLLSSYEIVKRILNLQGSIVDCGVYRGRSLMMFAQLSAILEPMNYQRRVIGFDTFRGFLKLGPEDASGTHPQKKVGGYSAETAYTDLLRAIELFDQNRFLSHIPKVQLVKGDIEKTGPQFVKENPHLVVSLLNLDLSLYGPTRAAIRTFVPRMPKGGVIMFGEMNCPDFSGEVSAVLEEIGIRNLRIERNTFDTMASFAVLE